MNTENIIQHLEQTQRDATENKAIEEIPQSELDQICGARNVGGFINKTWSRVIGKN